MTSPALLAVPQQLLHKSHSNNTISIPCSSSFLLPAFLLFPLYSLFPFSLRSQKPRRVQDPEENQSQKQQVANQHAPSFIPFVCCLAKKHTRFQPNQFSKKKRKKDQVSFAFHIPQSKQVRQKKPKENKTRRKQGKKAQVQMAKRRIKKSKKTPSRKRYSRLGFDPAPCVSFFNLSTPFSLSLCIPRSAFLSYSAVSTDLQEKQQNPNNMNEQ
jgi:hypothetical protein